MNYHSDDWIMAEVKKHYDEALTIFPKNRILGIFIKVLVTMDQIMLVVMLILNVLYFLVQMKFV